MIERDPQAAQDGDYDVVIVGGGIYGVCLALESVARRLRPLLLERADFGGATSAQTLRIIHGGFRYLQSLDIRRLRRSVEQRRWWLKTFPDLVRPLPCLMPLYGRGLRSPVILRTALLANDLLSFDRNRGLKSYQRIPHGSVLNPSDTMKRFPGCERTGLSGSALWHDASLESPHRLIVEMIRWVVAAGGTALNYVSARDLRKVEERVDGLLACDELTGEELEFAAPLVINAAGPWSAEVAHRFDREKAGLFRPTLAFNVLLRRELPASNAVAVSPPRCEGRVYFLRPVGPLTFAGTYHTSWTRGLERPEPTQEQVADFVRDLDEAIPAFSPSPTDVIRVFAGLLPGTSEGTATQRRSPVIVDHSVGGRVSGFFSVSGVKFTTAPAVARSVLDRALGPNREADWTRLHSVRPPSRVCPSPEEVRPGRGGRNAEDLIERLRVIVDEEAVVFPDDLVLRRLDWNLEDVDLEEGTRWVSQCLPGFAFREIRKR